MKYAPKVVLARINTEHSCCKAKRILNGTELQLGLWSCIDRVNYHIYNWSPDLHGTIMEVMFLAEVEAGLKSENDREGFIKGWNNGIWDPKVVCVFMPSEVEIIKVINEEKYDPPVDSVLYGMPTHQSFGLKN